jgi:cholinesterase
MRAANSTSIASALIATPSFTPTIDNTVVFNSSEYISRSLSGQFVRKPVLIGTNDNEEAIFRAGALLTGAPDQPQSTWDALNLKKFFCPCSMRANVSVYNQVPTWRYRWFGVFPNTNLTSFPDSGAYHGSEIPIIFKTTPAGKGIANNTIEELEVMAFMRGAWASFAKNPTSGLTSYGSGW